jgi:hypothetical protein
LFPRSGTSAIEVETRGSLVGFPVAKSKVLADFGKLSSDFKFEPLDIDPKALPNPVNRKAISKSPKISPNARTTSSRRTEDASPKAKPKSSGSDSASFRPAGDL